jgi:hypothetical protein
MRLPHGLRKPVPAGDTPAWLLLVESPDTADPEPDPWSIVPRGPHDANWAGDELGTPEHWKHEDDWWRDNRDLP